MFRQSCMLVATLILFGTVAFAQTQQRTTAQVPLGTPDERMVVPKRLLTPDQIEQAQSQQQFEQTQQTVQRTGEYVGLGREIGVAMKEGLEAITESATKFANSRLGTWTIFIIAYKIVGRDMMHFAIGGMTTIIWLPIWLTTFIGFYHRKVEIEGDEKKVEYEKVRGNTFIGFAVALAVLIIISCVVAFS